MKIVRFYNAADEGPFIGLLQEDGVLDFSHAAVTYRLVTEGVVAPPPVSVSELLVEGAFTPAAFGAVVSFLDDHRLRERYLERRYRLAAPLERPGKIVALGRNYAAHALEHARAIPTEPIIFAKPPSSVIGPEEPVRYPSWLTRMDPEVELAFVIGAPAAAVTREQAARHIAAWTVVNDVTARDIQSQDIEQRQPWFRSKGMDTFCPVGPCLVLPDEIGLPVELDLEMRVNGELRQHDNTRSLLFPPDVLVEFISRFMTLEPGDLVCTGTPEGMKPVHPGDVMEATVQGIGTLRNPVASS